jgi:hypothetical protein
MRSDLDDWAMQAYPRQEHQIVVQGESPDNPDARDEAEGHEDGSKAKENDGDNEDFGSAVLHGVTAHLGKCEKSMAARDIQNPTLLMKESGRVWKVKEEVRTR